MFLLPCVAKKIFVFRLPLVLIKVLMLCCKLQRQVDDVRTYLCYIHIHSVSSVLCCYKTFLVFHRSCVDGSVADVLRCVTEESVSFILCCHKIFLVFRVCFVLIKTFVVLRCVEEKG